MKPFQGVDYYRRDDLFTEEERTVRNTVRRWVDQYYMPRVQDYFAEGIFDVELIPQLAELGLLGIKLQGYGCHGMNNVTYGVVCQEIERGDSGLRSFVSVQNSLVMYPIHTFGTEEQKNRWLPAMARGEKVGCFGLTEHDIGSNPAGLRTRAVKRGGDYVIHGNKLWITNGELADVAIIWAKLDGTIRGFLVEKGTPGFEAYPIPHKYSHRASVTSGLVLDEVRVPADSLLPGTAGLKSALMCLNEARYGIAWGAVGAAMACYEIALDYANSRLQFEVPISSFQLVQRKLVKMLSEITKAQLLSLQLGRLKDEGKARHTQISLAKMNNVAEALKIARTARDILGANGVALDYHVIRHMLNLEAVYTYEGTHDIHTLIVGRDITGQDAFSARQP
ncbi:MAG: acyl-CoA dehydrogenase family protein [Deltaproteobacteria bacterium]|nr:acyl-CoA dehydrogenase family protein [Deltaproteobacteria bacterium]MBW2070481.1 acyl-CoA dehydrogenase family protein [Deltaproteobacteria bacterium]